MTLKTGKEKIVEDTLPVGTILYGKAYRYKIEKILDQGAFGITYKASVKMEGALGALDTGVTVAIKEFFMEKINGRENTIVTGSKKNGTFSYYKEKFIKEAISMSKLNHPNIVKVVEQFEANNTAYYVMEFIAGGSLDKKIVDTGKLSETQILNYARQIGEALQLMHSKHMLHLDLKPKNVMLTSDNTVKLIDFGLSKQFDDNGNPETSTTIGNGTPGYAPLEQANYSTDSGDFPATMDIYALGATIFKMATGHRPPDASDILNEGFPSDELTGISDKMRCLIKIAMSPIKRERFQTITKLIEEFDALSSKYKILELSEPNGFVSGHGYVDLGLPSGTKWANCNVGASSPYEYGNYYSWDDTTCCIWGKNWGTPTKNDLIELIERCEWEWCSERGKEGYVVIGPNKNCIFFPAAGQKEDDKILYNGKTGMYWSAEVHDEMESTDSWCLGFCDTNVNIGWDPRYIGYPIRPVCRKYNDVRDEIINEENTIIEPITANCNYLDYIDLGLPSGIKWGTCNIGANHPEENGSYFAWGETKPRKKFTQTNYRLSKKCEVPASFIKRIIGHKTVPAYEYTHITHLRGKDGRKRDAARIILGESWRMPTQKMFQELIDYCSWSMESVGGIQCRKVTGPNGNHIILPFASWHDEDETDNQSEYKENLGEVGFYWSSDIDESDITAAMALSFNNELLEITNVARFTGLPIRAVHD